MNVENERDVVREALETCNRVLRFDLRKMLVFGPDFNQAVKDAADRVSTALAASAAQPGCPARTEITDSIRVLEHGDHGWGVINEASEEAGIYPTWQQAVRFAVQEAILEHELAKPHEARAAQPGVSGGEAQDAARYRYLRSRPVPPDGTFPPGLFIGRVPENLIVTEEDADQAIDAAMGATPPAETDSGWAPRLSCVECGAGPDDDCDCGKPSNTSAAETGSGAMPLQPGQPGTRYRHVKRGGEYTLRLIGQVQTDEPLKDYDRIVVYQDDAAGMVWARPPHEFFDGRFERIADEQHPATPTAASGQAVAQEPVGYIAPADLDDLARKKNAILAAPGSSCRGGAATIALYTAADAASVRAEALQRFLSTGGIPGEPAAIDLCYTAFMCGRSGRNTEDGGPCDWFSDTKPLIDRELNRIRALQTPHASREDV